MDVITLSLAKKYANKLVADIASAGFAPKIVDKLPNESEANNHTLYLVPASDAVNSNGYVEYLYMNNKWECVGSTVVDFSMIGDLSQLTTEDKTTLVAAINEVFANTITASNEIKAYADTQITNLQTEINAKVFQGNAVVFGALTEKEQKAFDIAIVEPIAKLEEEELALVDSMVGGEATPTVVDMSENEIHTTLDSIIGGE